METRAAVRTAELPAWKTDYSLPPHHKIHELVKYLRSTISTLLQIGFLVVFSRSRNPIAKCDRVVLSEYERSAQTCICRKIGIYHLEGMTPLYSTRASYDNLTALNRSLTR